MITYNNFIGIDIGKFNFTVARYGDKNTKEYENTIDGIHNFIKDYHLLLPESLCLLEATGGYELELLLALCDHKTLQYIELILESLKTLLGLWVMVQKLILLMLRP